MAAQNDNSKPLRDVAAAVIQDDEGRFLIVQRGPTAPNFPNHWGVITGMVEPGESPEQTALREIREELGADGQIVRAGAPFPVDIGTMIVRVWPFLCTLSSPGTIQLNAENQRYAWVPLVEIFNRDTIPQLDQDFRALGLL